MKRVFRVTGQGKMKDVGLRGLATGPAAEDVDSTVALIQALIPVGLKAVAETLEAEVVALAGEWYRRTGGQSRASAAGARSAGRGGGPRPPTAPGAHPGRDDGGRPDESPEVDQQVHAPPGRRVDPAGAPGGRRHRGAAPQGLGLLPAGQRQDQGGRLAPARDAQFRYINAQVKRALRRGWPVLSVDAKKKERVGAFRNPGRTWRKVGQPERVHMHDFPHLGQGVAIPYGTYDIGKNQGLVNVGITDETAEFAVESIRRWWQHIGRQHYPQAEVLLICADSGGSNGSRLRAWKFYLQDLADRLSVPITVCHYPPRASKWNKIEHRMFSFISLNWRGQPLVSYETIINLISRTTTRTGLRIAARLDTRDYEPGIKILDQQMAQLKVTTHRTHPQWNYTVEPRRDHEH